MSNEQKQKRSQKIKTTISNWSAEKRKRHNELAAKNSQETRKNWTDDKKQKYSEHASKVQKKKDGIACLIRHMPIFALLFLMA